MFTRFSQSDPWQTPYELWHPLTIEFIYLTWAIHVLTVQSLTLTLPEISGLQGSNLLTSHEPKRPLTSTTSDMDNLLYETSPLLTYLDIPFLQAVFKFKLFNLSLNPNELWPTSKINILNIDHLYATVCMRIFKVILVEISFTRFWPMDSCEPK